jgi:hypothetical protein
LAGICSNLAGIQRYPNVATSNVLQTAYLSLVFAPKSLQVTLQQHQATDADLAVALFALGIQIDCSEA